MQIVCGEHGGDPSSVRYFDGLGLDFISCSPFRVPIAIIAAAQGNCDNWFTMLWYHSNRVLNFSLAHIEHSTGTFSHLFGI